MPRGTYIAGDEPGVYRDRQGKWAARIWLGGKYVHLGTFRYPQEASAARQEAKSKFSIPAKRVKPPGQWFQRLKVDPCDAHLLETYQIHRKTNPRYEKVYAVCGRPRRAVALARLIMNPPADMQVDHINGDTLDNRRENLRVCTPSQNTMNRRVYGGISEFKGVSQTKGRWIACIKANGKAVRLGGFDCEAQAALAYDAAARKLHGEFARLNFPREGERAARTEGQ